MIEQAKRGIWNEDMMQRQVKPLKPQLLKKFGLKEESIKFVNNLDELRESPPNIVVVEAKKTFRFTQNFFKEQEIVKKKKYVMGLGVFSQLQYAANSNEKLLVPSNVKFSNVFRPYNGQELKDGESITCSRTGGLGDLLFILPNLLYLKEKYPNCIIKFACGPQYKSMVEQWGCIDVLLDLPFTFEEFRKSNYHIIFEGVIERCKQAHYDNAYNLFSKWIGLDLPDELLIPKQSPRQDLVEKCLQNLNGWNLKEKDFIIMQLRASSPIRTPGHDFWVKIVNELTKRNMNVLITDNPRQAEQVDKFIEMCEDKTRVFNYCKHSDDIAHTIALTSLSKGILATDSALPHIAASLGIKSFSIMGPFPGHIRLKTYPLAKWVDAVRSCGPCFIHGHTPCPHSHDGCSPCYDELIGTEEKLNDLINKIEGHLNND